MRRLPVILALLFMMGGREAHALWPNRGVGMEMRCDEQLDMDLTLEMRLWQNAQNIPFFEYLPEGSFQGRSKACGLAEHADLRAIWQALLRLLPRLLDYPADHIIFEVGAGYGRAIEWLLANVPEARYVLFEQTPRFARLLAERYRERRNITVFQRSFLARHTRRKAHLLFLLWSTLVEFNRVEQLRVLRKVRSSLQSDGIAVVDLPLDYHSRGTGDLETERGPEGEEVSFTVNDHEWRGFVPNRQFFLRQVQTAGLTLKTQIDYSTSTGDRRSSYLLGLP